MCASSSAAVLTFIQQSERRRGPLPRPSPVQIRLSMFNMFPLPDWHFQMYYSTLSILFKPFQMKGLYRTEPQSLHFSSLPFPFPAISVGHSQCGKKQGWKGGGLARAWVTLLPPCHNMLDGKNVSDATPRRAADSIVRLPPEFLPLFVSG